MSESRFGTKDLYDVTLKATYDIELGNRKIQENEVILDFDNIQISLFDEVKQSVAARGGYDNRALVIWEETKELNFSFSQGIFSKSQLAILNNARLIESKPETQSILIPQKDLRESDENGTFELKYTPTKNFHLYDLSSGEKINNYQIEGNKVTISIPFLNVIARYDFEYVEETTTVKIGQKLLPGFVQLEGKTRLKDDKNGRTVTGLLRIPKLKLMSDLSIRLGRQANPVVSTFNAIGVPVGRKGNKSVLDIVFLSDDIDSDM